MMYLTSIDVSLAQGRSLPKVVCEHSPDIALIDPHTQADRTDNHVAPAILMHPLGHSLRQLGGCDAPMVRASHQTLPPQISSQFVACLTRSSIDDARTWVPATSLCEAGYVLMDEGIVIHRRREGGQVADLSKITGGVDGFH
jgi:hypothetical protein